ncbi:MBL fold metallo-hydrolase [Armatimonas rosea]|uniref:L-ascorbate metabolism protein UlaG (Beta-lactamase superfamily) n=1 Tax=Armatimonas rosea TaxID=685828 RepID=A0A7W9W9S5_ARMRO|nr:MBL fold metallo-hydrolase [Armatimonas rosea]MBB6053611.1 L-ascorbate metabolism protein UlaG (beta-lactamase superfamily) [Armatimonas rosea]
MIKPVLQDDAFLADVEAATKSQPDTLHVWWLGQSGYLVAYNGTRLLLDPYLSDSLTEKYAATDKPHTRMTERVVAPERLTGITAVTSSHNHTDHLDAQTLLPLFASNPSTRLVVPAENLPFATNRLGESAPVVGLAIGTSTTVGDIRLTAVPAAHEELLPCYAGFIVQLGPWTLYHSGDTIPYDGMEALLRPYKVDIAFLPINGRLPERRVSGNLWGDEAARLAKAIGAKCAIPGHYELFAFNTESPERFIQTSEAIGQPYTVLRAGERESFAAP